MADIEDVFEMPPMPAGMLLHTLMAPQSGTYFQQCWCVLEGPLDREALQAAWREVIRRHAVLRSECHWEDLERPVQVIYDDAVPEWHFDDWSHLDAPQQENTFSAWLEADRQRGFRLDKAPLLRFALMRLSDNSHRFVWSFHHLLMDGWCGSLLVGEMLRFYGGQDAPPIPPPWRRYVEWRAAQDESTARAWWSTELAACPETPLPGHGSSNTAGGVLEIRVPLEAELAGQLRDMVRRERLTLATVLQGAWALLLARHAGQEDVVFGTVLSGRPPELPDVENMVGLFLNTVPLRAQVPPAMVLRDWLHAMQNTHRLREKHGYMALADILRQGGVQPGESLFETLLIVENFPLTMEGAFGSGSSGLSLSDTGSYERTHYPLTLRIFPGEETVLSLTIDPGRICRKEAERLLVQFRRLLSTFASCPDARLGEISLLDAEERQALLDLGRGPETPPVPPVHELVEAQTKANPERTALVFTGQEGDITLGYRDLATRAASLCARLRQRGVGRGDVVAVCLHRGPDLLASLLGVMQAGAAYLPVDPDYPADRIAYMLRDSGASLLVTGDEFPAPDGIETMAPHGPAGDATPPARVLADDLAYILYTSGSTGNPKGVPITHGALSNFLRSMANRPGICATDRLLALTTVGFDIAGLELFGPLVRGATVIMTDAAAVRDGARLVKLLQDVRPTLMQATPAGWRMLIEAGWKGDGQLKLLCGGEALDSRLARDLLARGAELWNLYGPTETTIWSAATRVTEEMLDGPGVPVGGPLDRTQLYVLDAHGEPVPSGIAGELYIGGAGLSPGYHGKPALAAEKFVPNHLRRSASDSLHLYRTGDRVRWREDGMLEFMGRIDNQIKLRGYRIEPGEIEAQLAAHRSVAEAAVIVDERPSGASLVACIRWHGEAPANPADILHPQLAQTLPVYMLPASYISLAQFPLTPNGKVDRKALGVACIATTREQPAWQPVSGEPAATLADIWKQLLHVDAIGAKDNFFDLGGHSLLVIGLQGAIRERLGVTLDITDFFRFPTLETLSAHIVARTARAPEPEAQTRAQPLASGRERLAQRRQLRQKTARA